MGTVYLPNVAFTFFPFFVTHACILSVGQSAETSLPLMRRCALCLSVVHFRREGCWAEHIRYALRRENPSSIRFSRSGSSGSSVVRILRDALTIFPMFQPYQHRRIVIPQTTTNNASLFGSNVSVDFSRSLYVDTSFQFPVRLLRR